MNRREFFARFGAVAVAPQEATVMTVQGVTDLVPIAEHAAETAGAPRCPRCLTYLAYQTSSLDATLDTPEPIACPCGWSGVVVQVRSR